MEGAGESLFLFTVILIKCHVLFIFYGLKRVIQNLYIYFWNRVVAIGATQILISIKSYSGHAQIRHMYKIFRSNEHNIFYTCTAIIIKYQSIIRIITLYIKETIMTLTKIWSGWWNDSSISAKSTSHHISANNVHIRHISAIKIKKFFRSLFFEIHLKTTIKIQSQE